MDYRVAKIDGGIKYARIRVGFGLVAVVLCVVYPIAILTQYKVFFATALLSLVLIVFLHLLRGYVDLRRLSSGLPVYLFFCVALISVVWASYPSETLWRSSIALVFLWLFIVSIRAADAGRRSWIHKIVVIVPYVCMASFSYILVKYGSVRVTSANMHDDVGSFSNAAPALVMLCLPYLIYLSLTIKRKMNFLVLGSIVSSILVVLLSQSRGAYVILLVLIILTVTLFGENAATRILTTLKLSSALVGLVLVATLLFGYGNTFEPVVERFSGSQLFTVSEFGSATSSEPDYARKVTYLEGSEVIKDHWLTGIGYGGLGSRIEEDFGFRMVSHNIVITAWGELGLVGLLLLVWISVAAISRVWRARVSLLYVERNEFYFYSATLTALIVGLLYAQIRPQLDNPMFYVVLAIALSASSRKIRRRVQKAIR